MPICGLLKQELQNLHGRDVAYVVHEYLEDLNEPIYFSEFARRIGEFGLRYVADALINNCQVNGQHPVFQRMMAAAGNDAIAREQCIDFLINRSFRRSILVKESCPHLNGTPQDRFRQMYISSTCRPAASQTGPAGEVRFDHPRLGSIVAHRREMQLAMQYLWEMSPMSIRVGDLLEKARNATGQTAPAFEPKQKELTGELLLYAMSGLLDFGADAARLCPTVSARPRASALARRMAGFTNRLANLRHEMVDLDEPSTQLLQLLDGSRSVEELAAAQPGRSPHEIRQALEILARDGLLEA
jgi:methyltransferase-like protein